jgi:hypothetical protein
MVGGIAEKTEAQAYGGLWRKGLDNICNQKPEDGHMRVGWFGPKRSEVWGRKIESWLEKS